MEISKKELTELETKITSEIEHGKEPIESMQKCISILDSAILGEASFPDDDTSSYFYNNFPYDIVRAVLKNTYYKNDEVTSLIHNR